MTRLRTTRAHAAGAMFFDRRALRSVSTVMLSSLTLFGGLESSPSVPAYGLPLHIAPSRLNEARPTITASDNRRRAGRLEKGVLTLRIEARDGTWYPEGPRGPGLPVAAFAEEGRALQNPGPLVRVPVGTEVRMTVRNTLAKPLTLFGLGATRGIGGDSITVAPGDAREVRFRATEPGTFYYAGKTGRGGVLGRGADDSQLNGAIVVDPAGAIPQDDRVFVVGWWYTIDPTSPTGLGRATLVINGRSWPHTERIDAAQGDSLRWRFVNLTEIDHPLHLHGFYFRVDAVGDGAKHTTYAPDERRTAVTELLRPGSTMTLAWSPNRPGNWIFHCHFVSHISHHVALTTEKGVAGALASTSLVDGQKPFAAGDGQGADAIHTERGGHHGAHAGGHGASGTGHQMAGLVLGIRVEPRGTIAKPTRPYREMRLIVRSKPNVFGDRPGYAYALGGAADADSGALTVPGPTLELEKDEPVAITVVNRSQEPAAVHWHGIELESFPDGVPGWSGGGRSLLPAIAPGDSLTVRFTPPRAGTFMYHSHFNEFDQISSGLYGSIIVTDPAKPRDPETDRVLLFSDSGPTTNIIMGPIPPALLNGKAQPEPMRMRAGVTYRLRLINIRTDYPVTLSLLDGGTPVEWRPVAKDGADLPALQATPRPATLTFAAGEIHDVEFTPKAAGELTLRFGMPKFGPVPEQSANVLVLVR